MATPTVWCLPPAPAPLLASVQGAHQGILLSACHSSSVCFPEGTAAAAAKSLQSCPTLCDPTDNSPPGSSVPGILQARTLERVAISFSNACAHAQSLQLCPTLCDPMDSSPPGSSGKELACRCKSHKRCEFHHWLRKIPWRRAWQPTPVLLPGECQDRGTWWAMVHGVTKSRS